MNSKNHMHPMDYWYRTNKYLKDFYEAGYNKNIDLIQDSTLKMIVKIYLETEVHLKRPSSYIFSICESNE